MPAPTSPRTLLSALLVVVASVVAGCSGGTSSSAPASTTSIDPAPVSAAPSSTTAAPSTTSTVPADPARKVLVVGDSTAVDAGPALTAMFEAAGAQVAMAAGTGFGLTAQGTSGRDSNFRTDFPRLLDEESPDLVVVLLGVWDQHFVEQRGVEPYAGVVEEAVDILSSRGARILWLAMAPNPKYPERVQDGAYEAVASRHPGTVVYADYLDALRGPAGDLPVSYAAADGSTVHLRKADAFHFCPDGAARLADHVNRVAVANGMSDPAAVGWQDGAWRGAEQYDDPACRQ